MTIFVDGNEIAKDIASHLREQVGKVPRAIRMGMVAVDPGPTTLSYLKRKTDFAQQIGVEVEEIVLPGEVSLEELKDCIKTLEQSSDGVVVQLPLPAHLDYHSVVNSISPSHDVDSLRGDDESFVESPVALAIAEILERHVPDWRKSAIVVVGEGKLVGKPTYKILADLGCCAEVINATTCSEDKTKLLRAADIVISGTGVSGLITADQVSTGVVLIDAGTATSQGAIVGDIDPDCYAQASVVSPVPGGVGPISVAKLFTNLVEMSMENRNQQQVK